MQLGSKLSFKFLEQVRLSRNRGEVCQAWLVNVPTIGYRSCHAWPADVRWADSRRVKGCVAIEQCAGVRGYNIVEVSEPYRADQYNGSVVLAGVKKPNIVSRLTFTTFYFTVSLLYV